MKIRYAPLALACVLMVAASAQAAAVTYSFGGTLDSVAQELSFLTVGDSFTGSFTFESSSMNVSPIPGQGTYIESFAIDATVNGYSFSSSSTASDCSVACGSFSVGNTSGGTDVFLARNAFGSYVPVTGPSPDGFSPYDLTVALFDFSGTVLNSDALPPDVAFSSFGSRQFSIAFLGVDGNGRGAGGALAYLTLNNAAPVPEASTSAMLALGLGALALMRRRKGH